MNIKLISQQHTKAKFWQWPIMRGEIREDFKSGNMTDEGVSVEKQQELLLINKMAANGKLPPKSQSNFLQKKLQQRKFFDSGDYAMNQNKEKKHPVSGAVSLPQATAGAVPALGQPSAGARSNIGQAAIARQDVSAPPALPPAAQPSSELPTLTPCVIMPETASGGTIGASGSTGSDEEECHLQIPRPDTVPQRKASILHPSVHSKLSPQPLIHHDKNDELITAPSE